LSELTIAILDGVSKYTWVRSFTACDVPGELVRHVGGGFVVAAVAVVGGPGVAN